MSWFASMFPIAAIAAAHQRKKAEEQRKMFEQASEKQKAIIESQRQRPNQMAGSQSNATLFPQSPRPRTLYEASPARQYDSGPDITDMMNPANPLSPLFYPASAPAYEPEPARECPAPSYEPDTSTRYDSCPAPSYDIGSSYDSGSSSCDSSSYSSGD